MHSVSEHKMPVVIVNANIAFSLTVIREMGRRKIPVYAIFGNTETSTLRQYIVSSSRYIRKRIYFSEQDYEKNLLNCLLETGRTLSRPAVIIPVSDKDMEIISRNREKLAGYFRMCMPDHATIEKLLNKHQFYRFAKEEGLPISNTFFPEPEDDLTDIIPQLRFPCLIKPTWRQDAWFRKFRTQKVITVNHRDALLRSFKEAGKAAGNCIIQEIIPGREDQIYCAFTFLDHSSEPLGMFICRKIRQYPAHFGDTSMAESIQQPEVATLTRQICKQLGLKGYISIEFKFDAGDETYKIIEITPGRINRQTGISIQSGISIPGIWYDYLTCGNIASQESYQTNVRWISEFHELLSFPAYIKSRQFTLKNWLRSYKNVKGFEIFSRDDLLPFLLLFPVAAVRFLRNFSK